MPARALLQIRQHRRGQRGNPRRPSPTRTPASRSPTARIAGPNALDAVFGEFFGTQGARVRRVVGHRGQLPGARDVLSAVGHGAHARRGAHRARRMRRAGILHRRRQAFAGRRRGREDRGRRSRARGSTGSSRTCTACSRACCRSPRPPNAAPSTRRRKSARSPKIAHDRGMARAHGRRALRERAGGAERVARRADLESGRRRAVVRRHQEWRHECRGRGVLRSDPGRGLRVPPQARRATRSARDDTPRCSCSPISKVVSGGAMPSEPTGSRRASRPRRRALLSEPFATNQVFMQLGERASRRCRRSSASIPGARRARAKRASCAPGTRPRKTSTRCAPRSRSSLVSCCGT